MASTDDLAFLRDSLAEAKTSLATMEDARRALLVWASQDLRLSMRAIAEITGTSHQAVGDTVKRFKREGDPELIASLRIQWEARR